jgi:translocation and assembly module TamB
MSRRRKVLLWAAGTLAMLAIAAGVAGVLVLRSDWLREKVRIAIVREIENATGGRASLGAFHFEWRTLRAGVRDFVLRGEEPPDGPPLAGVRSIAVGLKVLSFFRRKVDLLELEIDGPEIFLAVDENGRWNLPRPKVARSPKQPIEQFLDLEIDRVAIRGGLVRYADRAIPLALRGEDLAANLSYVREAPAYRGEVAFRRVHMESPWTTPLDLDFQTTVSVEKDVIRLPRAVVAHRDNRAELAGEIVPGKEARARFDFTASLSLAQLRAALGFREPHRGVVRARGQLSLGGPEGFSAGGSLEGEGVAFRQADVVADGIGVTANFTAGRSEARFNDLRVSALGGAFTGAASIHDWKQLSARGELSELSLARLGRMRIERPLPYAGILSGPVEITAVLGRAPAVALAARLAIAPVEGEAPLEGMLDVRFDQRAGKLEFGLSHLATPATRLTFSGSLASSVRAGLVTSNLDDVLPALSFLSGEDPEALPVRLARSQARFEGEVTGSLDRPHIRGDVSLGAFEVQGRAFDRFSAGVEATPDLLRLTQVAVDRAGARLTGTGEIALDSWRPSRDSAVRGEFEFRDVGIGRTLADYGSTAPVDGTASGRLGVEGTVETPRVSAKLSLARITAWDETIDAVFLEGRYENSTAHITSGAMRAGAGELTFAGSYEHTPGKYDEGRFRFRYAAARFRLGQWKAITDRVAGLQGDVEGRGAGMADLRDGSMRLAAFDGNFGVRNVSLGEARLGDVSLEAATRGRVLHVDLAGAVRDSKVDGFVEWVLAERNQGLGELRVSNLTTRALQDIGFLGGPARKLPFAAAIDGEVGFRGPLLEPSQWETLAKVTRLEIAPLDVPPAQRADLTIRNTATILAYVSARGINVPSAHLRSRDTDLTGSGNVSFRARSPWNFQLKGTLNLAVLTALKEDLEARGLTTVDAAIRGSFAEPQVTGRMELRDATFALRGIPNGLEKANGVIRFDRTRATIESLTAMTGGGDIRLSGFVGFGGDDPVYRLQADAERIRVRYPEGVSTSLSAKVQWTGSAKQSLVAGTVTINRIGLTPDLDFGGLLAQSGRPTPAPAIDNEFLREMQFDIRVVTAANAELQTSLTRDIQPEADLRLRGGPARPVLLGRVAVNEGQIQFFGNQYTITRGEVAFFNPVKLDPVLNMDLETKVRGVTVTINFTGPINRLNVSYRSDPPFESSEIVALLTVGRAPGSNITPSAGQSQSGVLGAGGNTLLGSALSAPISGRLQKFFGVSRLKIDPELTGVANTPQARLTIEQQLTRDVTLTYITNLNRTQQQIVRLQWDFSRDYSLLVSREENGVFGADFQYRRRFK